MKTKNSNKKGAKPGKGDDYSGGARTEAIGSVTVTCASGPMGMKNVTVTATGVTAPFGPPATCSLTLPPQATLNRNGSPVDSKPMNADSAVAGKWAVTFFAQPSGTFAATVNANWQIMKPESGSGTAVCT